MPFRDVVSNVPELQEGSLHLAVRDEYDFRCDVELGNVFCFDRGIVRLLEQAHRIVLDYYVGLEDWAFYRELYPN